MSARFVIFTLGLIGGLLTFPSFGLAHKLHIFVTIEPGPEVAGRVYYSRTTPFRYARVDLLDRSGKTIKSARSDEEGRFHLKLKDLGLLDLDGFTVRCETKDGHGVEHKILANALTGSQDKYTHDHFESPQSHGSLRETLALELRPLKEQINALETKIWLRDVLGGLGMLMGVFGLWMFWLARSHSVGQKE